MEHKAFVIYKSHCKLISKMTIEQKWLLFQKIIDYHENWIIENTDPVLDMAFEFMKINFDIDMEKYKNRCLINAENWNLWGRPKEENRNEPKKPSGLFWNRKNRNEPKKPKEDERENENEDKEEIEKEDFKTRIILHSENNENQNFFSLFEKMDKWIEPEEKESEEVKNIVGDILENKEIFRFWNYWSEKDSRGKMRWEKEKTFELKKRLRTWASRIDSSIWTTGTTKKRVFWE